MINIVNEKPSDPVYGRPHYTVQFVDTAEIHGKRILNIGCGFGWFEFNMLKRHPASITAIEVSYQNLETIKSNIKHKKMQLNVGSALNLPFKDNSFDTVVSWDVIEHIPKNNESIMFAEAYRVLKNSGYFYLSTPFESVISNLIDPAWWLIGHRHYSIDKLTQIAIKAGFSIKTIEVRGGVWDLFGMLNLYIAKWIFRRRPFFQELFQYKITEEYMLRDKGFVTIFLKCRKNDTDINPTTK